MPVEQRTRTTISSFQGDFEQLARVMQCAWGKNKEQSLLYTQPFLRSAFEYPGSSFDLAPSIYKANELLAFVAGFPRSVCINGDNVRLLLNSFLTASADSSGAGYGLRVWQELINRARAHKFDGTINFCVEGDAMNTMMPGLARLLQLNTRRIYRVEFLSRFLRPVRGEFTSDESSDEIEIFRELSRSLACQIPLARTWTYEEVLWQCRLRSGAITARVEDAGRRGMITGYIMPVAANVPTRVALVEDVLWGNLDPAEQNELLIRFLRSAALQGAQTISCPVLGYASMEPFLAAGFQPSRRVLHAYLTLWNGLEPHPVSAAYIDVL